MGRRETQTAVTGLTLHEVGLGALPEEPFPQAAVYAEEILDAPDPRDWAKRRAERAEREARRAFRVWKQTPYGKRTKRQRRATEARLLVLLALYLEALAEEVGDDRGYERRGAAVLLEAPETTGVATRAWTRMRSAAIQRGKAT